MQGVKSQGEHGGLGPSSLRGRTFRAARLEAATGILCSPDSDSLSPSASTQRACIAHWSSCPMGVSPAGTPGPAAGESLWLVWRGLGAPAPCSPDGDCVSGNRVLSTAPWHLGHPHRPPPPSSGSSALQAFAAQVVLSRGVHHAVSPGAGPAPRRDLPDECSLSTPRRSPEGKRGSLSQVSEPKPWGGSFRRSAGLQ